MARLAGAILLLLATMLLAVLRARPTTAQSCMYQNQTGGESISQYTQPPTRVPTVCALVCNENQLRHVCRGPEKGGFSTGRFSPGPTFTLGQCYKLLNRSTACTSLCQKSHVECSAFNRRRLPSCRHDKRAERNSYNHTLLTGEMKTCSYRVQLASGSIVEGEQYRRFWFYHGQKVYFARTGGKNARARPCVCLNGRWVRSASKAHKVPRDCGWMYKDRTELEREPNERQAIHRREPQTVITSTC